MALNTLRLYEKFKTRFDEETSHLLVESLEEVASQLQIPQVELLATKEDLRELRQELLGEIGKLRQELLGEIGKLRRELLGEIGKARQEFSEKMGELRQELLGKMGEQRQELLGEIGRVRQEMGEMRVSLIKWMVSLVFIHLAAVLAVMSLVVVLLKGG